MNQPPDHDLVPPVIATLIAVVCLLMVLTDTGIVPTPLLHPNARKKVEIPATCEEIKANIVEMVRNNITGEVLKDTLIARNETCHLPINQPL